MSKLYGPNDPMENGPRPETGLPGFTPDYGPPPVDDFDPDEEIREANAAADKVMNPTPKKKSPAVPEPKGLKGKTMPIDGDRWNRGGWYGFEIRTVDKKGEISNKRPNLADEQAGKGVIKDFRFTWLHSALNIPPQALSVSLGFTATPFAANKGVIEEHNGIVFRNISISGTTGLWPDRPVAQRAQAKPWVASMNKAQSIFPGAISAITETAKRFGNLVGKNITDSGADNPRKELTADQLKGTGYYQFWKLHNFLVEYAEAKKLKGGKDIRLVFHNTKDNLSYVATPVGFSFQRSSTDPLLYRYNIQLRAYDLITPPNVINRRTQNLKEDPTSIKSILAKIQEARRAIVAANNVLNAAQSDIGNVVQVLNQSILAVKDVAAVGASMFDFLPTMVNNIDLTLRQTAQALDFEMSKFGKSNKAISFGMVASSAGGAQQSGENNPTGEEASSELTQPEFRQAVVKALKDPELSENILIDSIALPPGVANEIANLSAEALKTTASQVSELADKLGQINDNLAYSTGMMDEEYAKVYNLPVPEKTNREPTEDDIILSAQIDAGRNALIETLADGTFYKEKGLDPFSYANRFLDESEQLVTPQSATPVFVDKDFTLDDIARKYLGESGRAKEIALLNGLRAPYIDEDGFSLPITQASGRTFMVESRDNLTVGQTVKLMADGHVPTRRRVLDITPLGPKSFLVAVDGAANLNLYTPNKAPKIHARTPGTVGSGDVILIPSEQGGGPVERSTPAMERLSYAEKIFKADMALDEKTGDISITQAGDIRIAYGYENAVQAIKLKLQTERGELDLHPGYGIDARVGERLSSGLFQQIEDGIRQAIVEDPRFTEAFVASQLNGTALRTLVEVSGANGSGVIPLEFEIDT